MARESLHLDPILAHLLVDALDLEMAVTLEDGLGVVRTVPLRHDPCLVLATRVERVFGAEVAAVELQLSRHPNLLTLELELDGDGHEIGV